MFDANILLAAIGIFAVVAAVFRSKALPSEGFVQYGLGYRTEPSAFNQKTGQMQALQSNYMYTVPGYYQAQLSPRAASVNYGANIRYNPPPEGVMGIPKDPLSLGNVVRNVKEDYVATGPYCNKGGQKPHMAPEVMQSDYMAPNYKAAYDKAIKESKGMPPGPSPSPPGPNPNWDTGYVEAVDMLPITDMTQQQGGPTQPIVFDNFMMASLTDRLRANSDYIRGDLAIAPQKYCDSLGNVGWFNVSTNNLAGMLNLGALNVMGGYDNTNVKNLTALVNQNKGGTQTFSAGYTTPEEVYPVTGTYGTVYKKTATTPAHGVQVTAFP